MIKTGEVAIQTEAAYLNRLGRTLLRYFPIGQVDELLEDYQEHFSLGRERGGMDGELIAALGTPEAVTKEILKEMPEGWLYLIRHTIRWGLLLLFAGFLLFLRYTGAGWAFFQNTAEETGSCVLLLLSTAAMFALLRGREMAAVEGRFLQTSLRPGIIAAYILPAGAAAALEALLQYLLTAFVNGSLTAAPGTVGSICNVALHAASLVAILTAAWCLWRSCGTSVRYFPAAVHAAGALLFVREIERVLHSMDVAEGTTTTAVSRQLVWEPLAAYCLGFFLALLFWCGIRKMMRRGGRR